MPSGKHKPAVCMNLIPNATNTKAELLIEVCAIYIGIDVPKFKAPRIVYSKLCAAPPVTIVTNGPICTTKVTVPARKSHKSTRVISAIIG